MGKFLGVILSVEWAVSYNSKTKVSSNSSAEGGARSVEA